MVPMRRIEVYSSPWCPWCWKARLLLRSKGFSFVKIPIRMYLVIKLPTSHLRTMIERSGGDSTVPQIFVDGHYLGTDDTLEDLDRQGRLEEILSGQAPIPGP